MTITADPTYQLACQLISRQSVTPQDAGCQPLIARRLENAGFVTENLPCGDVDNLLAMAGEAGPLLCFAGHTDVVPTGPIADWRFDPFEPTLQDGVLYGRGAADMKGSVAAMVTAMERLRANHPDHGARLALLLTSDEEGPARDGTRHVVDTLSERGQTIDWCVVGEPSSSNRLGDTIKNGRRGSLTARMTARGKQGHVAYPQLADNALHRVMAVLTELASIEWDAGDAHFPPTSFQVSNLNSGTGADNVIPGVAQVCCNFRYSPALDADTLRRRVGEICDAHGLQADIDWHHSGKPFFTAPGVLVEAVQQALEQQLGQKAALSTGGGTSDGRFIAPTGAQVVELGPTNATIHQTNEHVTAADLPALSLVYERIMEQLLVS